MNDDSAAPAPHTAPLGVNPGYAAFQLAKALTTGVQHAGLLAGTEPPRQAHA